MAPKHRCRPVHRPFSVQPLCLGVSVV